MAKKTTASIPIMTREPKKEKTNILLGAIVLNLLLLIISIVGNLGSVEKEDDGEETPVSIPSAIVTKLNTYDEKIAKLQQKIAKLQQSATTPEQVKSAFDEELAQSIQVVVKESLEKELQAVDDEAKATSQEIAAIAKKLSKKASSKKK